MGSHSKLVAQQNIFLQFTKFLLILTSISALSSCGTEKQSLPDRVIPQEYKGETGSFSDTPNAKDLPLLTQKKGWIGDPYANVEKKKADEARMKECEKPLLISSFAKSGCGELTFKIFQADLNTGECRALGYWNDDIGQEQIGIFNICGLRQGLTYTNSLEVGPPITYESAFGMRTVLSFSSP
jgi:hypothetical protein